MEQVDLAASGYHGGRTSVPPEVSTTVDTGRLRRRLRPIYVAAFLQNVGLWVPIEKLFMTDLGFDNGSVAIMAAVYTAVLPALEVPSGILADRWSRRGVVVLAQSALIGSTAIGGFATNVGIYLLAALFLGVYFALQSGMFESIIYDTVLEETGEADLFERTIGRVRVFESTALVLGALAGAALAELMPLRATYFMTIPFVIGAVLALRRLEEPHLHQTGEAAPLRQQVAQTTRTLLERGGVRPLVALLVLTALLSQSAGEFGQLWLVDLDASAGVFGPHWAGLMAALGVGGLLGAHLSLARPLTVTVVGGTIVTCCVVLATSQVIFLVVVAQSLLMMLVVALSIPTTRRLHDAIPSTIRAGVTSGVGTATSLAFLPFALIFGAVSDRYGIHEAGWTLVAVAGFAVIVLLWSAHTAMRSPMGLPLEPAFPAELFRPDDDPNWPGHWIDPPAAWHPPGVAIDTTGTLNAAREAIADLPSPQHEVLVARDIARRSSAAVRDTLNLNTDQERQLLNQARGQVRARLDQYFKDEGS